MQPKLKVEKARTDDLVPYARNAKLHSKKQVGEIANSIEAFGFNDPIGVWTRPDGQLEIVEGHGRVMAAKLLGIEEVPIIRLDHLDDDGRRAYTHVHNQTTLTSGFDMPTLDLDLEDIPGFDWSDFGFGSDWFADRERFDDSRQEGNDEYNEWLDKFEPKKTTDDCYTPDKVYEAVADWTAETYGVARSSFIRPFYPGGDYQREEYPAGCVVAFLDPRGDIALLCRKGHPILPFRSDPDAVQRPRARLVLPPDRRRGHVRERREREHLVHYKPRAGAPHTHDTRAL